MGRQIAVTVGGEEVRLLAARALYWPRGRTLFMADPHFGKAESFQAAGMPIPGGATEADLARLGACIDATGAARLVILGDFFHTKHSQSPAVLAALTAWRARHTDLGVTLVRGNHDRHAGAPPDHLCVEQVDEPWTLGPFACCHHPPAYLDTPPAGYALVGHEHPAALLRDVDGTRHRFPCFHVGVTTAVLPAFGTFTGAHAIRAVKGDRVFVISGEAIHAATPG